MTRCLLTVTHTCSYSTLSHLLTGSRWMLWCPTTHTSHISPISHGAILPLPLELYLQRSLFPALSTQASSHPALGSQQGLGRLHLVPLHSGRRTRSVKGYVQVRESEVAVKRIFSEEDMDLSTPPPCKATCSLGHSEASA